MSPAPSSLASANDAGPEILVYPPYVSITAPVAAVVLEYLVPLGVLPEFGAPWMLVSGGVLVGLAGWLAVSGTRAFTRAGTNVDPRAPAVQVVRDGPYRFTRNPMYLGMVLLQVGLGLLLSLDWALLAAPLVWAVLHFGVVLREEAYLGRVFGAPYKAFCAEVPRWLGSMRRART